VRRWPPFPVAAGWLGLRVWGQTGPLFGERGRRSGAAAVLDGSGSCSTLGTQTSLGRALSGAAFRSPLVPTGLALRRHGRIHRGVPKSGSTHCLCGLARLPTAWSGR
jgi:hypothetical protein